MAIDWLFVETITSQRIFNDNADVILFRFRSNELSPSFAGYVFYDGNILYRAPSFPFSFCLFIQKLVVLSTEGISSSKIAGRKDR